MAVETGKSLHISNRDTNSQGSTAAAKSFGLMREGVGLVTVAAAGSVGSKYILMEIGSGDRLSDLILKFEAIGAGAAANIGLYETTFQGGAVVDADLFAGASSIAAAGTTTISPGVLDTEKMIYELLGLAKDPCKQYDLVLTLTGAAVAGGKVGARARYVTF